MSTTSRGQAFSAETTPTGAPGSSTTMYSDDDRGYGWVAFAGVLLLVVGTLNCIEGIAAIGNAHFFHSGTNTHYIMGSLNAWGWTTLIIGVVQLAVGVGVFAKNQFARWVGVIALACNAVAQLLFIPAYPFWSLALFAIDILAIYGLVAYGKRIAA